MRNTTYRKMFLIIFFIGIIFILSVLVIRNMGKYLVYGQPAVKSDLIVILLGPVPDRALQAYQLYHEGYATRIVFANEFQYGSDQLEPYGIRLENTSSILKRTLVSLGVPDTNITILDKVTASTQEEALALTEYLKSSEKIKSVLIVTSSYHSRRTSKIFQKAFDKNMLHVSIISCPSKYTDFDQSKWWRDRDSAKMVILEYLKLMNYYFIEQFKI
ncbi:MAG: YdcF family protein [Lentimicrobiaceae bacterium]|nr:YdcF family protein [Lentimicrobiaceae bacterium]MCO5265948.1 YdcF family protein [Lentimicrobium sp.]